MTKRWGTPVWYFLHTFAEQINPVFYEAKRDEICNLLRTLFTCLPCPECSKHSTAHTKDLQGKNVRTKEELKTYMFNLHNKVNAFLKKPQYTNDGKYKLAEFDLIRQYFYGEMLRPTGTVAFLDASRRRLLVFEIDKFVTTHRHNFGKSFV
jgi:hypothetical protein